MVTDDVCDGGLWVSPRETQNLRLDARLVDEVWRLSGESTPEAAVAKALQEFIAQRSQRRLLELVGALQWNSQYDYKNERDRLEHSGK